MFGDILFDLNPKSNYTLYKTKFVWRSECITQKQVRWHHLTCLVTLGGVYLSSPAFQNPKQPSKIHKHWKSSLTVSHLVFASVTTSLPLTVWPAQLPGWPMLMAPSTLQLCCNQEQRGAASITESFFPLPLFSTDFLPLFLRYSLPTDVSPNRGLFRK